MLPFFFPASVLVAVFLDESRAPSRARYGADDNKTTKSVADELSRTVGIVDVGALTRVSTQAVGYGFFARPGDTGKVRAAASRIAGSSADVLQIGPELMPGFVVIDPGQGRGFVEEILSTGNPASLVHEAKPTGGSWRPDEPAQTMFG